MRSYTYRNRRCAIHTPLHATASAPAPANRVLAVFDRLTGAFPAWVLTAAVVGVMRPSAFNWFTPQYTTAALAFCMLAMGMTLTIDDFKAIARRPKAVAIGTGTSSFSMLGARYLYREP